MAQAIEIPREQFPEVFEPGLATAMEVADFLLTKFEGKNVQWAWFQASSWDDKKAAVDVPGMDEPLLLQGWHHVYRLDDDSVLDPMKEYDSARFPWRKGGPLEFEPWPKSIIWPAATSRLSFFYQRTSYGAFAARITASLFGAHGMWPYLLGTFFMAEERALGVVALAGSMDPTAWQPQMNVYYGW